MNPMLDLITRLEQSVDYGTVQLTIKRHDSHTTSVDGQKLTSHKTDGSQQALSIVIALLKAAQANRESGSLTFTIVLNDGVSDRVVVQDVKRLAL